LGPGATLAGAFRDGVIVEIDYVLDSQLTVDA
jgi:hypothetical protein